METTPVILLIVVLLSGFAVYQYDSESSYYTHTVYKNLEDKLDYNSALILKNSTSSSFKMLTKDDNCDYTLTELNKNRLTLKCGKSLSYDATFMVQYFKNSKWNNVSYGEVIVEQQNGTLESTLNYTKTNPGVLKINLNPLQDGIKFGFTWEPINDKTLVRVGYKVNKITKEAKLDPKDKNRNLMYREGNYYWYGESKDGFTVDPVVLTVFSDGNATINSATQQFTVRLNLSKNITIISAIVNVSSSSGTVASFLNTEPQYNSPSCLSGAPRGMDSNDTTILLVTSAYATWLSQNGSCLGEKDISAWDDTPMGATFDNGNQPEVYIIDNQGNLTKTDYAFKPIGSCIINATNLNVTKPNGIADIQFLQRGGGLSSLLILYNDTGQGPVDTISRSTTYLALVNVSFNSVMCQVNKDIIYVPNIILGASEPNSPDMGLVPDTYNVNKQLAIYGGTYATPNYNITLMDIKPATYNFITSYFVNKTTIPINVSPSEDKYGFTLSSNKTGGAYFTDISRNIERWTIAVGYPANITIDVANNSIMDFTFNGYLNVSHPENESNNFFKTLDIHLQSCNCTGCIPYNVSNVPHSFCSIPIVVNSTLTWGVNLTLKNLSVIYNNNSASLNYTINCGALNHTIRLNTSQGNISNTNLTYRNISKILKTITWLNATHPYQNDTCGIFNVSNDQNFTVSRVVMHVDINFSEFNAFNGTFNITRNDTFFYWIGNRSGKSNATSMNTTWVDVQVNILANQSFYLWEYLDLNQTAKPTWIFNLTVWGYR